MDDVWMRKAMELAGRGTGLVSPNPLVGAVVVRDDEAVGEGWHEGPGRLHAEAVALAAAGKKARGATLYVTLEPCAHQGKNPPCVPLVIDSGIARVVVATLDPNPLVDGRGIAALRGSGIEVETGVREHDALRQNAGFIKHIRTGLPHVTLKMAASLDGKAAARDGTSKWISGGPAREEVHRLRATAGAIVVGAGTAFRDDPSLTARHPEFPGRRPLRVIVDGAGIVPETHSVFTDQAAPTLVVTSESAPAGLRDAWADAGAEVLVLAEPGSHRVAMDRLLAELGKREIQRVLIEGGPTLAWEVVRLGLVDELVLFLAPILVGGRDAPSVLMGEGIASIADPHRVNVIEVSRVGDDIKVVADVHRDS
ncbi:MAG: bifunctional diaminohydroxyphosphoribosylaminopyrimidine deaminase/5-amino-6-(5-phosphoribosylamino)uracil reductase RibD [Actinomycetota bacterium]